MAWNGFYWTNAIPGAHKPLHEIPNLTVTSLSDIDVINDPNAPMTVVGSGFPPEPAVIVCKRIGEGYEGQWIIASKPTTTIKIVIIQFTLTNNVLSVVSSLRGSTSNTTIDWISSSEYMNDLVNGTGAGSGILTLAAALWHYAAQTVTIRVLARPSIKMLLETGVTDNNSIAEATNVIPTTPYVIPNLTTSLDKITVILDPNTPTLMTGQGINTAIPITRICKWYEDASYGSEANGHSPHWKTGEWIAATYFINGSGTTKNCTIFVTFKFTLNNDEVSIEHTGRGYNSDWNSNNPYNNGDWTGNNTDLNLLANNLLTISGGNGKRVYDNSFTYNIGYVSISVLDYSLSSLPLPLQKINNLSANKVVSSGDVTINNRLFVGGGVTVTGELNADFADGVIPTTAIVTSSGPTVMTGNVTIQGEALFNGTVETSSNTYFKVNNQIEFANGSTYSHDQNPTFEEVTVTGSATAGSVTTSSDYRIKNNVEELDETDTIDNLNPIEYDNIVSNNHEYGLIAHELQEHYPYLVKGNKDDSEHQQVYYNGLIGLLVKEVQELKKQINLL